MAERREGRNEWWRNERITGPVMSDRDVTIRDLIAIGHECTVRVIQLLAYSILEKNTRKNTRRSVRPSLGQSQTVVGLICLRQPQSYSSKSSAVV